MNTEVLAILEKVKSTADFGYVEFTDVNATNELGDNALHCVIVWDDIEAARALIKAGINLNQKGEDGRTPLVQAIDFGNRAMVELLLQSGADPLLRPDGYLPVTYAIIAGRRDLADIISSFSSSRVDESLERKHRHMQRLSEGIEQLTKQIEAECGPKTEANQALLPTPTAVTTPAAQDSRQP